MGKTALRVFFIPFLMSGPIVGPLLGSSLRTGPEVSDSALAWAASQHTDTSKHTKAALKRYVLQSYLGTLDHPALVWATHAH